jgi:hypothetical protein
MNASDSPWAAPASSRQPDHPAAPGPASRPPHGNRARARGGHQPFA